MLAEACAVVDVSIVRIFAVSGGPFEKDNSELRRLKFVIKASTVYMNDVPDSTKVSSKDIQ